MSGGDDDTVPPEMAEVVRNVVADQQAVVDTRQFIYDEGNRLDEKVLSKLALKLQNLIQDAFPEINCAGAAYAAIVAGATVAVHSVNLMQLDEPVDPAITVDFRRAALLSLFGACMRSKEEPSPETLMAESKRATKQ